MSTLTLSATTIRPAQVEDVAELWALLRALAEYQQTLADFTCTPEDLMTGFFSANAPAYAVVAEQVTEKNSTLIGCAVYARSFSTLKGKPALILEDLFVLPQNRKQGVAKQLMQALAQAAQTHNAGQLNWIVLDWNEPAKSFYNNLGAKTLSQWQTCKLSGAALAQLQASASLES